MRMVLEGEPRIQQGRPSVAQGGCPVHAGGRKTCCRDAYSPLTSWRSAKGSTADRRAGLFRSGSCHQKIVKAIEGRQPPDVIVVELTRLDLPLLWSAQELALGIRSLTPTRTPRLLNQGSSNLHGTTIRNESVGSHRVCVLRICRAAGLGADRIQDRLSLGRQWLAETGIGQYLARGRSVAVAIPFTATESRQEQKEQKNHLINGRSKGRRQRLCTSQRRVASGPRQVGSHS